jgi:sialic acid synthase SpsE/mannose-6-phosphate isomerase-like protein (cupin superfamily)
MKDSIAKIFDMSIKNTKPLFILEIANNHMGDVSHGLKIIREFSKITKKYNFKFAFKFQYRYLDTFVHPDYIYNKGHRLIKRFTETILNERQYKILKDEVDKHKMISVCTPWDNKAVDLIASQCFDIIKIPSCYFNDWPLLEKIAEIELPIIASTAGATLENIDNVVSFFRHRKRLFALMHCVGEYPTANNALELNQIDLFKKRYTGIPIGFSTHEDPNNFDSIKVAIAKGATIFEKHIGIPTKKYRLNTYSATPEILDIWLKSAKTALSMCGKKVGRHKFSTKEKADLRILLRGGYAKDQLKTGDELNMDNIFFAMPNFHGQLVANNFSKYTQYICKKNIKTNDPIMISDLKITDKRKEVMRIVNVVKSILLKAKIALPNQVEMELSHHYGLNVYNKWGAAIINVVNREYCKKLIILVPGQKYPVHSHKRKNETLQILYGSMRLVINNNSRKLSIGDVMTIERNVPHSFDTKTGVVFEEISTTYYKGDSFWKDSKITKNINRKTFLTYWLEDFNDLESEI